VFFRIETDGDRKHVVLIWVEEADDDEATSSWAIGSADDDIPF